MGTVPSDNLSQEDMVRLALSICIIFIIGLEALPKPEPKPKPWGYRTNRHHNSVCHEPMSTHGGCGMNWERWTYNRVTGICEYFKYGGCGASENIFTIREECERTCVPPSYVLPSESNYANPWNRWCCGGFRNGRCTKYCIIRYQI